MSRISTGGHVDTVQVRQAIRHQDLRPSRQRRLSRASRGDSSDDSPPEAKNGQPIQDHIVVPDQK